MKEKIRQHLRASELRIKGYLFKIIIFKSATKIRTCG